MYVVIVNKCEVIKMPISKRYSIFMKVFFYLVMCTRLVLPDAYGPHVHCGEYRTKENRTQKHEFDTITTGECARQTSKRKYMLS